MFGKAFLSFAFIVSVLFSGVFCVQAQIPQQGASPNQMQLPKLKFPEGKSSVEVPFETSGNWMVIPVSVNGSRPLRFVFDSGASGTVLSNSALADTLDLKFTGTRQVRGAGGGGTTFEVKVAEGVNFNIGGIELSNVSLSRRPSNTGVDGVIGRVVFATTVVEIDWEKRVVRFYEPSKYKYSGSGAVLPLTFDQGGRPYTMATVSVSGDKAVPVKVVVDTGGSHALFLELASPAGIRPPAGSAKTTLGRGASGEITGFTGRVKDFGLGKYSVKDVPTGFLDASGGTAGIGGRDGNLGGVILRRFKIIYDYSRQQMIVEPNKFFADPFAVALTTTAAVNTDISPSTLNDYIGRYGERTISVEGSSLFIQRPGGQKLKLIAASVKDEFSLEQIPAARIKFVRGEAGKVTEIQVLNPQGQWENSKKEQSKLETLPNQSNEQSKNEQLLSEAEREVRKLEREWLDAYEKRDAEAMNRILSDDFKLTFSNGSVQTKADVLAQIKSAQDSGRPSPKLSTEDVQSRLEGDSVILTGRFIQRTGRDDQARTMQMRYSDIYVKRGGRWQIIASQLTRIQQ
ncbi:MAG TPA: aspartyl protease family protein [Pyrinomonadaceae bacterium]|jgi:uncharacterized protein (TIGR02246 family)